MTKSSNGKGKAKAITTPLKTNGVEGEIWKPTHVTSLYEVSNLGRVRRTDSGFVRKNSMNYQGYQILTLPIGGKSFTNLVGRLVLGAFERAPIDGDVANHIDRNRANDVIQNLRWTTIGEASTGRRYPSTLASKPVVATPVDGGKDLLFISALEAAAFVGTSRGHINDAIRFGRLVDEYTFKYDKSGDPTCEVKTVAGCKSHLISRDGRVRMANGRWTFGSKHRVKSKVSGKQDRCYRRIEMTILVDGVRVQKKEYVHVLAAKTFLGECPDGYEVDHIDGNESNNDVSNLEYVSKSENNKRAYSSGKRKPPGQKAVLLIKTDGTFKRFKSSSEGARQMGVNVATVSTNCKTGRLNRDGEFWAHDKPVVKHVARGSTKRFESLPEASMATGENIISILLSCRNTGDESWKYAA